MINKKISIAMATYNGEHYIEKQLDTILYQTRVPDEVIICDDSSNDQTAEIIKKFIEDHRLVTWHLNVNESNVGYKRNFYNAISKTTGDVIFLADQDDEWCENKLEKMTSVLEGNEKIVSLSCAVELIDGDSKKINHICQPGYYNCDFLYLKDAPAHLEFFDLAYIAKHNISPGCAMVITRLLAEKFLKAYNFELPHDWFLNLLAAADERCGFLNESLIRYRRHNNNTIGANNGVVTGIRKKTRDVRIEDFKFREKAINIVRESGEQLNTESVKKIQDLYDKMIDFYQSPSLIKLLNLRKNPDYFELAKRKVRLWEFIVAIRLDTLALNVVD
ncbi:glycosyltransferase [Blautia liquoris]|uniref:Glycosyltransferase n=1 Tax=Blautia liquoris TaxID=2779518 RepID=A0A7M2RFW6_9FIRM|nr:glycosyltransferase [Blautia liquoris]QOV18874.1 glycosyltransferase [Blautia liquoris]